MTEMSKPKVLVVDDAPVNIDVLIEALKADYKLSAALTGEQALRIAQGSSPPDLIILDVMMPGMDGYEVCHCLQADPKTAGIPVIFVTAKDQEEDEALGFAAGAVDYITKPICPTVVRARVKTHISLKKAREELLRQNEILLENARLKEDVDRITRHDMKSPLTGIIALPELIRKEGNLNEEQTELLELIEQSGYRLLNMINLYLDLYKMETGKYAFVQHKVDLVPILKGIAREMDELREDVGAEFVVLLNSHPVETGDVFLVEGEELLCYSMFANLVRNALEASKCGGDKVTVGLLRGEPCSVSIHNPAPVPEPARKGFFDKYVTYGKERGTGLGTYSAKLIAETQRGGISMTTSDTEGTTVTVTLRPA